ncbi:hypothetical protein VPHD51_0204 [Vibrio phage D51]
MDNVIKMLNELSNDKAAQDSMVCQLWSDGEITLQKGGDLLGMRTLHCIHQAVLPEHHLVHKLLVGEMPHQASNGFGFLYCSSTEEAAKVRNEMIKLIR